jgi:hypothetical protein
MDRSTVYTAIVRRFHWAGRGTWLLTLFYPRAWWAQRKLDRARLARFNAFKASLKAKKTRA